MCQRQFLVHIARKHLHIVLGIGWLAVALTVIVFVVCASPNRVRQAKTRPSVTTLTKRAFAFLNIVSCFGGVGVSVQHLELP